MTNHLESLARRLEGDPFFLACPLAGYARSENLNDAALAAALKCSLESLTMIRLCRSPDEDRFKADIDAVAARFHADADVLALAVRRGQVLATLQSRQPEQTGGMLLAARDDDRPDAEAPS